MRGTVRVFEPERGSPWYNNGVSPSISPEIDGLVRLLYDERSLVDRIRGIDRRLESLSRIAQSRDFRVVPDLLPLLAAGDASAPQAARTIAALVRWHSIQGDGRFPSCRFAPTTGSNPSPLAPASF